MRMGFNLKYMILIARLTYISIYVCWSLLYAELTCMHEETSIPWWWRWWMYVSLHYFPLLSPFLLFPSLLHLIQWCTAGGVVVCWCCWKSWNCSLYSCWTSKKKRNMHIVHTNEIRTRRKWKVEEMYGLYSYIYNFCGIWEEEKVIAVETWTNSTMIIETS